MRIISKHNDVYDLQHSLFDADRTWVREQEVFQVRVNKETESLVKSFSLNGENSYKFRKDLFCYPVQVASQIHWLYVLKFWDDSSNKELKTFDAATIREFVVENELEVGNYFTKVKGMDQVQQKLLEVTPAAQQILNKLNVPLSMIRDVVKSKTDDTMYFEIITNFNFNNEKLPWQELDSNLYRMHQEIESYIWGVIGNGEKQTVEVSDLDRLKAYGFDEKFSFRNRGK